MTAGSAITLTVVGAGLLWLNDVPILEGFRPQVILAGVVFSAIGGLLAVRVPGNPVGWVVLIGSLCWAVSLFCEQYAWFVTFTDPGILPGGALAAWTQTWIWVPGTVLLLTALPLLFPDGHLPSPRWRWIAWLVVGGAVIATAAQLLKFWPPSDAAASLLGKYDTERVTPGLLGVVVDIANVLESIVGPLVGASAVIVRLRRAVGVERQQMRWFAYAIAVTVATLIFDSVVAPVIGWTALTSILGIALIPMSLAIAILRYRLYEIDRIISRTLSYAVVSVALALVFVGVVLGLTAVLEPVTRDNTIAVAASTLVVAALFQPLRLRIQRIVDRRFDRARYDAEWAATAFAARLRGDVNLASVQGDLLGVVVGSLQPASVAVWTRDRPEGVA
ncbi:MAG TPA: hypothetical protein VMT36_04165 [Candidatus Saccharimonadia bacterium]|nr:hypothetical protein [Candidatus Saccharimonadia bacterium]